MIKSNGTIVQLFPVASCDATASGTYMVDLAKAVGKFTVISTCSQVVGSGAIDVKIYSFDTSGGTETLAGTVARVKSGTGAATSGLATLELDRRDVGRYLLAIPTVSGTASGYIGVCALYQSGNG